VHVAPREAIEAANADPRQHDPVFLAGSTEIDLGSALPWLSAVAILGSSQPVVRLPSTARARPKAPRHSRREWFRRLEIDDLAIDHPGGVGIEVVLASNGASGNDISAVDTVLRTA
jgi:hypothetical protein